MTILITGRTLTLDELVRVARDGEAVRLDPAAREEMGRTRAVVEDVLASGTPAYGRDHGGRRAQARPARGAGRGRLRAADDPPPPGGTGPARSGRRRAGDAPAPAERLRERPSRRPAAPGRAARGDPCAPRTTAGAHPRLGGPGGPGTARRSVRSGVRGRRARRGRGSRAHHRQPVRDRVGRAGAGRPRPPSRCARRGGRAEPGGSRREPVGAASRGRSRPSAPGLAVSLGTLRRLLDGERRLGAGCVAQPAGPAHVPQRRPSPRSGPGRPGACPHACSTSS